LRILDRINSMPANEAVRGALTVLNPIQGEPPEVQVMGVAVLFYAMCIQLGLDPSELMDKARRMAKAGDLGRNYSGLTDYVNGELR
jgi:hypothetical protein